MDGTIFDIRRFSIHDGPGIRTAVFLKGCPLHCLWCQNPEGIESDPRLAYFQRKCLGCLTCVASCPKNAISPVPGEDRIAINRELCDSCGMCAEVCPARALAMIGRRMTADEVASEILRDELFYGVSDGGATLTGGEPLMQPEFCLEVLQKLRLRKIHTAMETSLFADPSVLVRVRGAVDLFIVDIKMDDRRRHAAGTGKGNEVIRENFRFLASLGTSILARVPLIPGFTVDLENLYRIGAFIRETRRDIPVELMNFNPLARDKYVLLDKGYALVEETRKFTAEEIAGFEEAIQRAGARLWKHGVTVREPMVS